MTETRLKPLDVSATVNHFLSLAGEENWSAFDEKVIEVSNRPEMIGWLPSGFKDERINVRDLAISISEKTSQKLDEKINQKLVELLISDPNTHLRRKAAIALFVKGNRSPQIKLALEDAMTNDDELRDQVSALLKSS